MNTHTHTHTHTYAHIQDDAKMGKIKRVK